MPDVDWEKVAEAVDEWGESLFEPGRTLAAAARWGLEAQQRGERVHVYGTGRTGRTIERAFDAPPSHLLVPLEAPDA